MNYKQIFHRTNFFQLEKSPTLGSIETSDYDKRQFAYQSLEFNLKDKQFCDLFPDTVSSIQVRKFF